MSTLFLIIVLKGKAYIDVCLQMNDQTFFDHRHQSSDVPVDFDDSYEVHFSHLKEKKTVSISEK